MCAQYLMESTALCGLTVNMVIWYKQRESKDTARWPKAIVC